MATFVLLHGSFPTAWNWHRLIPALEPAGHRAVALDLPGHGRDRTPASRVSLTRYVDAVFDRVSSLDSSHSPFFSAPQTLAAVLEDSLAVFGAGHRAERDLMNATPAAVAG